MVGGQARKSSRPHPSAGFQAHVTAVTYVCNAISCNKDGVSGTTNPSINGSLHDRAACWASRCCVRCYRGTSAQLLPSLAATGHAPMLLRQQFTWPDSDRHCPGQNQSGRSTHLHRDRSHSWFDDQNLGTPFRVGIRALASRWAKLYFHSKNLILPS